MLAEDETALWSTLQTKDMSGEFSQEEDDEIVLNAENKDNRLPEIASLIENLDKPIQKRDLNIIKKTMHKRRKV